VTDATLAAILVVVRVPYERMAHLRAELRAPKSDVAVLLATSLLTVLVDLTVAIEVGMVLAAFLFMAAAWPKSRTSACSTHEFTGP